MGPGSKLWVWEFRVGGETRGGQGSGQFRTIGLGFKFQESGLGPQKQRHDCYDSSLSWSVKT